MEQDGEDPPVAGGGGLHLTLVHGTFSPEAPWVRDEGPGTFRSRLREALKSELGARPVRFDDRPFSWGGQNRWTARREGARALHRHLDEVPSQGDERFVIAHSHGGNVALWSLETEPRPAVRGLVCLATPFLDSRLAAPPVITCWVAVILSLLALVDSWPPGDAGAVWWARNIGLILLVAVTTPVLWTSRRLYNEFEALLKNASASAPNVRRILARDRVASPCPLLNLRVRGDKAEALLGGSDRIGRVLSWILRRLDLVLAVFLGPVVLLAVIALVLGGVWPALGDWTRHAMSEWLDPVFAATARVAIAILLPLMILQIAFGFDELRWILCARTEVGRTPHGSEGKPVEIPAFGGLDHSLYDHQDVPSEIAQWIGRELRSSRDGPSPD